MTAAVDPLIHFAMPKPVKVSGRSSSITNSFVNAIIPVIVPTAAEVGEALEILGMSSGPVCSYCGGTATEWDHLRPLIVNQAPTGYISEIHNLVPSCGKCNQSKGNKDWRTWMFGPAKLSPATRGVVDIDARAEHLSTYEAWRAPTKLDFAAIVGHEAWALHEANRLEILALMKAADAHAATFRERIATAYSASQHSGSFGPDAIE